MSKLAILVAAAGRGSRMGKKINKQFLHILGKPIIYYTLKSFLDWEKDFELTVVLASDEINYFKKEILPFFKDYKQKINLLAGGKSRKESVANGLNSFSQDLKYVIIHDGARPLIKKDLIEKTYQAVKNHGAVSCGVKVKDTIKVVENSFAAETLDRDKLWAIQTPQAFKLDLIKKAHLNYKEDQALDDASLVEEMGKKVYIIEGDYNNFKITTPADLKPAEAILRERK